MSIHPPSNSALRSTIASDGRLHLTLIETPVAAPAQGQLLVRVEAAPVNPSDIGLLLGPADVTTLAQEITNGQPALVADVPRTRLGSVRARLDQPLPAGNEGAGTVVDAGPDLMHLVGRRVGMFGGSMYAQFRLIAATDCLVLPNDATSVEGASLFVNPLTSLAMVETLQREGHRALVHTAAASNLGQMLNRLCLADGIALVNIVRNTEQKVLLQNLGARHVIDSTSDTFPVDLVEAVSATGATIAFDAVGGGRLANTILHAMEAAALRTTTTYNRYGSDVHKQVYIYGALDNAVTELDRGYGLAWGIGGFLLMPFLQKIGPDARGALQERVLRELKTTFVSRYSATIGLTDLLDPKTMAAIAKRATGAKYLVDPRR